MKKILLMIGLLLMTLVSCSGEFYVDKTKSNEVPSFTLKTLDGKKVKSNTILKNGKPTLFVVAAEWCPHCKEEAPDIERFYNENKDKVNVVVVYTDSNSSLAATEKYLKDNGYTFPAYYDDGGTILRGFGVQGFPYNAKIENGKLTKELEVPFTYEKMIEEFGK